MQLTLFYKGLSDLLRLRILNLLFESPLCVCHLMEILDCGQVRMSKQLKYLKELGVLTSEQAAQWRIYRLTEPEHPLLTANLNCLRATHHAELGLLADLQKRTAIFQRLQSDPAGNLPILLTSGTACCV